MEGTEPRGDPDRSASAPPLDPSEPSAGSSGGVRPELPSPEPTGEADLGGRPGLRATVRFFDEIVEDTSFSRGRTLQIGHSGAMAVPVPRGWPFLARVQWTGRDRCQVTDGTGRVHALTPGGPVRIGSGPIALELSIVPRFLLRRTEDVMWWGSLTWLAAVLAATLLAGQAELVWNKRCEWFGIDCAVQTAAQGGGGMWTAEYLERLLRKDYAGEREGVITHELDRETGQREGNDRYIPAGSDGPATRMGGARDVAPQEVRAVDKEEPEPEPMPEQGTEQPLEMVSPEVGTSVQLPEGFEAVAEVEEAPGDDDRTTPTEDHEGWGVQDWYDASDQQMEELEIEVMLRSARHRLAIDPNDPSALETLSYYQYLAQDYDAAMETYDKFIGLYPDHSSGYNNKALIYKRRGSYQQEEALYRVALALSPDDETALNNLAVCLAHQGRYAEALAIMARLEVLDPGDAYADLHRSKIYAQMGDDDTALMYLEKALDGMLTLDTLHHIEFRQDIRLDPSFEKLRQSSRFHAILYRYYGSDSPLQEGPG